MSAEKSDYFWRNSDEDIDIIIIFKGSESGESEKSGDYRRSAIF
jgi:hypothetical protein